MPPQARSIAITPSGAGHIGTVIRALVAGGWTTEQAPEEGRLVRNQQLIVLQTSTQSVSLRLLAYKVTESSRNREAERRVEITSTYGHGVQRQPGFRDVVLGYEPRSKVFVGLDPVRLRHGGKTSNASSFLEAVGLRRTSRSPFMILLRPTRIFPNGEYQAFFRPERLGEYLLNFRAIHAGNYPVTGVGQSEPLPAGWHLKHIGMAPASARANRVLVLRGRDIVARRAIRLSSEAIDIADGRQPTRRARNITPDELRAIKQRQEENGHLGEEFVYDHEKRALRSAGRSALAERVDWTGQRSVGAGYDIRSFNPSTGAVRYIEVKSCDRPSRTFDTSANEWAVAAREGESYYIYRVSNVRAAPSITLRLRDPVHLAAIGRLQISESGWKVRIVDTP